MSAKTSTIYEALTVIESELGISPPIGSTELPPPSRFRSVLIELKSRVCPKVDSIRSRLEADEADLASIVADTIITGLTQIPLPVTTVSKKIAAIGLERFCTEPASILEESE